MRSVLGVDNVLFDVGDLERARAHYAALGLVERFVMPGLVLYALGSERPGLLVREQEDLPERKASGPHLWLEVDDAAVWRQDHDLAAPLETIRTGRVVEVADPWGNAIGFVDYTLAPDMARP